MKAEELLKKDLRVGIYLCTQGHCDMSVNDKHCHIVPGNILVKSPLIQLGNIDGSNDFEFTIIVEDDIECFVPIASENIDIIQTLLRLNKFNYILNKEEQAYLLRCKHLIEERKREMRVEGISVRKRKLIESITIMQEQVTVLEYAKMLMDKINISPSKQEKEDGILVQFLFLLFRNYKNHREVNYYADALRFSPNHFTRIIKKASDRTPSEWIVLVTINQAKKLLHQQNTTIKEVSLELNFPDQFTFRKYFKKYTGIAPKEYRMPAL